MSKNYEGTITVKQLMQMNFKDMDQVANAPVIKIIRKPKDKNAKETN